jgi:signal transduction histidine kinase
MEPETGRKAESQADGLTANELDQWLMSFSHEFRTPLNSVLTFSDFLLRTDDGSMSEEVRSGLEHIRTDGGRLLRLVEKLSLLIDLEKEKAHFEIGAVSIRDVVDNVIAALESDALNNRLKTGFQTEEPVNADPYKLEVLVEELLENALVHGEPEQPIYLSTVSMENGIELSVENAVSPEMKINMANVFKKFAQGNEGDLTAKPPGLGIGLTICLEIAKQFDGTIACERPAMNRWTTRMSLKKADAGKGK